MGRPRKNPLPVLSPSDASMLNVPLKVSAITPAESEPGPSRPVEPEPVVMRLYKHKCALCGDVFENANQRSPCRGGCTYAIERVGPNHDRITTVVIDA